MLFDIRVLWKSQGGAAECAPEAVDAHFHAPPAGRLPAGHQPARVRPRLQHVYCVAALRQVPRGAQPRPDQQGTAVSRAVALADRARIADARLVGGKMACPQRSRSWPGATRRPGPP